MDMIPELCWCTWPPSSGAGSPTCWTIWTGQYAGREGSENFSKNQDILVTLCFLSPGSRRNSDALPLGIPLKISKVIFDLISRWPIVDYLLVKYLRLCMMTSKARTTSFEIVNFDQCLMSSQFWLIMYKCLRVCTIISKAPTTGWTTGRRLIKSRRNRWQI